MAERRQRRGSHGIVEIDSGDVSYILEPAQVEVGSGYALAVSYDENENPIVDIKTYGQVDLARIRREVEQVFPNAQIRQLSQTRSVTIARKSSRKSKSRKK